MGGKLVTSVANRFDENAARVAFDRHVVAPEPRHTVFAELDQVA